MKTVSVAIKNRIPRYLDGEINAVADAELRIKLQKLVGFLVWCISCRDAGKKRKIFSVSSKSLKRHAGPKYAGAIDWLMDQGIFTFISGKLNDRKKYKNPDTRLRGYRFGNKDNSNVTKRFGFHPAFVGAIEKADFVEYDSAVKIQIRKGKEEIAHERKEEAVKIENECDRYVAHVRQSLKQASFPIEAIEAFSKANNGHGAAASVKLALMVNNGEASAHRTGRVGKLYSPLCSMASDLRDELRFDGEKTVQLDKRSNHIYMMLGANVFEGMEGVVVPMLKTGDFWKVTMEKADLGISKADFKKLFWRALSSKNDNSKDSDILKMREFIGGMFPRLLNNVRRYEKLEEDTLQVCMQRFESEEMNDFVDFCIKRNVPVITIYDGVILKQSDEHFAYDFFGSRICRKHGEKNPLAQKECRALDMIFLNILAEE